MMKSEKRKPTLFIQLRGFGKGDGVTDWGVGSEMGSEVGSGVGVISLGFSKLISTGSCARSLSPGSSNFGQHPLSSKVAACCSTGSCGEMTPGVIETVWTNRKYLYHVALKK